MEALRIISDEHQSLAAVLHAVRFMLKEIAAGRLDADGQLFAAMVHYLDAYAEQRHHPKEDLLFARLAGRTGEGGEALASLAVQHAAAGERIAHLRAALEAFLAAPGDIAPFALAFERYAEFYRTHMLLEEEVVLPLVRRHLTAEDWLTVDAQFRQEMVDKSGRDGRSEDFSALFSRLVDCAPPPIGLGPRPFAA